MNPTRFTVECDLARYALSYPEGAFEAWNTGEIFQGHATTDILAAALAAAVIFQAKPREQRTPETLYRLSRNALRIADAWTDSWHPEIDWHSPVWGPREIAWAVNDGVIGWGGFDTRQWIDALAAFFPFVKTEAA